MNIALLGALAGFAVGLFLVMADYISLRAGAIERAKRKHARPELNGNERERVASLARFCVLLPPLGAFIAWMVWG